MLDLATLTLPPKIQAFIEADNEAAWNALADANELPHPLDDRVHVDSCQVNTISLCARLGLETHVSYLFNRATLYEKEIIFDVRGCENVFHAACQGGHLQVVETLLVLAPDKALALVEMNNFRSFQLACASGNPLLVQRLVQLVLDQLAEAPQLAHEKVQAMVEAGKFDAFRLACAGDHLVVVNRLVELAPDKVLAMVEAFDFYAFRLACEGGHLAVVDRLVKLAPGKVVAMVEAFNFYAFQYACKGGHLSVVERLIELVSLFSPAELAPKKVQTMIEAGGFSAFQLACEGGQLVIVERLVELVNLFFPAELASKTLQVMVEAEHFHALQMACKGGHLAIVERLIELVNFSLPVELASKTLQAMVKTDDFHAFQLACEDGHLAVVERLIELVNLIFPAELASKTLQAMVEAGDFHAFLMACNTGHLGVVNRLVELAPNKVLSMVKSHQFYAFQRACKGGHLAVIERLIELLNLFFSAEFASKTLQVMVEAGDFYAFQLACEGGHLAVVEKLIELVNLSFPTEQATPKVQAMVEARNFEAFIFACKGGRLAIVESLIALSPEKLMTMVEVGGSEYLSFGSFQGACANGHLLAIKRLIELVSERAPDRVQPMLEADSFGGLKNAYRKGYYRITDLLLRNEFVLRHAVDESWRYSSLASGFVNVELNILAATKSAFESENPGLRFNIPKDKVSYYVLMLGHMCGCEDFPNRQKHIDLLMGLPSLNPLPAEHYQWCLDKALNANNAKTALRLLSKYPGPKDVATESGRIKIKPIHELFVTEGGQRVSLMHNLHLLLSEQPERYHRLLEAVRLKSEVDSNVYSALFHHEFSNVEKLWSEIGGSVNYHLHSELVMFRNYWRISKGLSTASTIAASASAPKPSRGPGR